jgi:hypothetical protein
MAVAMKRTLREAAVEAGISLPTLVRWCKQPAFQRMIRAAGSKVQDQMLAGELARRQAVQLQPA